jgi:hypothetical protein
VELDLAGTTANAESLGGSFLSAAVWAGTFAAVTWGVGVLLRTMVDPILEPQPHCRQRGTEEAHAEPATTQTWAAA